MTNNNSYHLVITGTGFSALYMRHKAREMGLSATILNPLTMSIALGVLGANLLGKPDNFTHYVCGLY